jgi:hypothetical protein
MGLGYNLMILNFEISGISERKSNWKSNSLKWQYKMIETKANSKRGMVTNVWNAEKYKNEICINFNWVLLKG